MSKKKIRMRTQKRAFRVRGKFVSRGEKPRVSIYRSLNHIYAQIIDDNLKNTLTSFSSQSLKDVNGDKKAIAKEVGKELGRRAREQKIHEVFFDRGSYKYHGRVAALADGLRESGLKF